MLLSSFLATGGDARRLGASQIVYSWGSAFKKIHHGFDAHYVTATLSRNYSGHSNPLSYADCRLTPLVNNNYYILIYLIFEQVTMYYSLSFPILSMAIKPFMGPSYHTLVLELLSLVCAMKHLSATVI